MSCKPIPPVLLLCTARASGGAENHALTLFEQLLANNCDTTMLISKNSSLDAMQKNWSPKLSDNIVKIKRSSLTGIISSYFKAKKIAKICRDKKIKIIQCNEEKELNFAKKIVQLGEWESKPSIVFTRHIKDKCKKDSLKNIAAAIGVSTPITKYLKEEVQHASCIPPLYEAEKFLNFVPPTDTETDFFKKNFNIEIDSNKPIICVIANLYKAKNHKLLLQAVSKIAKEEKKTIQLVLAGSGHSESKLKKLSRELKISEHTHFVGFTKKIPEILFYSDFNVLPSKREGLGISLLEAALMKKASIVASGNGSTDLIKHMKTGLIFENNNMNDCAKNISYLINNPETTKELGVAAYNYTKEHFLTEKNFPKYVDLYRTINLKSNPIKI